MMRSVDNIEVWKDGVCVVGRFYVKAEDGVAWWEDEICFPSIVWELSDEDSMVSLCLLLLVMRWSEYE